MILTEKILSQDVRILNNKEGKMIKYILLLILILFSTTSSVIADEGYISPESYAVNEADLNDYMDVAPSPKLKIDDLDNPIKSKIKSRPKKLKAEDTSDYSIPKPVKQGVIYHMAKWWVDQRYKREEPHHGEKHEIKVKARMEYEKQQTEQNNQETQKPTEENF